MTTKPAEVQAQLERILASSVFSSSARSAQFLRFCVEQSLLGNHDQIKESTVAVEVFGRDPDYNPRTDPIVRVHAKRLRDKLDQYYQVHGADDPIRITIPKGTYIPQTVRTLPRFDPRLVEHLEPEKPAAPPSPPPVPLSPARHTGLWLAVLPTIFVATLLALFLWRRTSTPAPTLHAADEGVPLNAEPGRERTPTWSPDGKTLAFSWDGGLHQSPKIYLQRVGQSQPYRLTHRSESEFRPVWSPDRQSIAFLRYRDASHFEVIQASVQGDQERSLGIFSYYWPRLDDQPALDWSPDGKTLLVAEQPSVSSPVRLFLLNLATGERSPLTNPPSGTSGDIDGKFSPDGSLVALHRGGHGDLYIVSAKGESSTPARALTTDNPGIRGITWSRNGRHLIFSSRAGGSGWALWQVDLDHGQPKLLLSASLDLLSPAISPDGTQLAFEREDHVTNLVEISLDRGSQHTFAPSSRQDFSPVYSPDGTRVVFLSTRSGPIELWTANSDGSSPRQLTRFEGVGFPITPSWSPDGARVVYAFRRDGKTNLMTSEIATGSSRQLTFSNVRYLSPAYSEDGRSIYFESNAGGVGRIWRMSSASAGQPEQTFWDVGSIFMQSPDRKTIFFKDSQPELHIARRDLDTGQLRDVFHSDKRLTSFEALCAGEKTIYLNLSPVQDSSASEMTAVDLATGRSHVVVSFQDVAPGMESGCSVSPDGRRLLTTSVQRDDSDIYTVHIADR
jgi:Tol biopolymer transport system component